MKLSYTCPGCMTTFEAERQREFCTPACRKDWTKRDKAHRRAVRLEKRAMHPTGAGKFSVGGGNKQAINFNLSDHGQS